MSRSRPITFSGGARRRYDGEARRAAAGRGAGRITATRTTRRSPRPPATAPRSRPRRRRGRRHRPRARPVGGRRRDARRRSAIARRRRIEPAPRDPSPGSGAATCRIGRRRVRGQRASSRLRRQDAASVSDDRLARERAVPGQHLEQHHAERPDVRALVDRAAPAPARGSCRRRCRESRPRAIAGAVIVGDVVTSSAATRRRVERLRQPEVQHLHRAVVADLDVRRLQIAMDDPLLVRRFERLGDLLRDRQRLVERNRRRARCARRASAPSTSSITSARDAALILRGRRCARCSDG